MLYDARIEIRCKSENWHSFRRICQKMDKSPSEFIREIIGATTEGRLTIKTINGKKNKLKEIYK